jgi:GNAT superfamily N-acetyltransferase
VAADPALSLRPAGSADVPRWLALFDAAVAWLVASGREGQWGVQPLSTQPEFPTRVRRWVERGDGRVAELDGELVGALMLGPAPDYVPEATVAELYVEGLVVSRRHAGRRVGETLLAAAVDEARQRAVTQVRLDCWAGGDGALVRYYERLGFRPDGDLAIGSWSGRLMVHPL